MGNKAGFTLIELSIVLVIIGLVAGGIMMAKNMIAAAELRTVMNELNIYKTAVKEFADKYQALPGDMNNAENYWGSDTSCPSTPTNTIAKTATCNGNGDGMIGDWEDTTTATAGSEAEWFRAWQQLADASLIEGMFTGVAGSAGSMDAQIGVNVPASRTGKGGWTLLWMLSDHAADVNFFKLAAASNMLMYGGQTSGSFTDTPILTATEQQAIDRKLDDGLPFSGNIRAKKNGVGTCMVSSANASDYMTGTTPACQLIYILGM